MIDRIRSPREGLLLEKTDETDLDFLRPRPFHPRPFHGPSPDFALPTTPFLFPFAHDPLFPHSPTTPLPFFSNYPPFLSTLSRPLPPSSLLRHPLTAQVNNINITIFDEPYDGGFELTSRKTGDIAKASFEKGYLYDGIPWYQAEKINSTYKVTEVPFSTGDYFYPLYSGVAFCTPFHYEKVIYDPTLSVLFGSSPSPNGAPSSSSNAWKIAVGVSLGAVAIIILIIVLLVVFYAPFRNLVRPYSGRKKTSANDNNLDTSLSHSPKNQGSTAANKKSEPSWNSAQKPLSV